MREEGRKEREVKRENVTLGPPRSLFTVKNEK